MTIKIFNGRRKYSFGKNELIAKYNVDVKTLDFSIDDFTVEELEEKFKALNNSANKDNQDNDNFALTSNVVEEICNSLSAEKVQREWGECSRYSFVDCDLEAMEVYCWDRNDWLLYGFGYKLNGDSVVIDFESKNARNIQS